MKKMDAFKGEEGFTLIELMVVVAIIGILSAIAVPNFKQYQAKSKQSEAKIQLSAVYTVESASMADYDAYATCIGGLGYENPRKGYYRIGFVEAHNAQVQARTSTTTCPDAPLSWAPNTFLKAGLGAADVVQSDLMNTSKVSDDGTTFIAGAVGNISASLLDKWTVTQGKAFTNNNKGY